MNNFDYIRPATVQAAVVATSEPGAAYLAAGTNLLDLMKGGVTRPGRLVDITHLPDLDRIDELPDGGVRIGALVRNAELARNPSFARRFPAVAEALLAGASAQLRNAATVGGNLWQRTGCAYFYDVASACNKRAPGSGCDARGGDNRLHAILGWSERCIATHPSDFCVPLVALDAVVEIEGKAGLREIPLEKFHRLPFLGGGFRLKRLDLWAADSRNHGGHAGRQARQARAASGAHVWPRGSSAADAADAARWRAHG